MITTCHTMNETARLWCHQANEAKAFACNTIFILNEKHTRKFANSTRMESCRPWSNGECTFYTCVYFPILNANQTHLTCKGGNPWLKNEGMLFAALRSREVSCYTDWYSFGIYGTIARVHNASHANEDIVHHKLPTNRHDNSTNWPFSHRECFQPMPPS